MKIKNLIDEDFINFKIPSMFIGTSKCDFKCDKECGTKVCQNSFLAAAPIIDIDNKKIIERYINNDITQAIVIGGLEPFDTFDELYNFIQDCRSVTSDIIIIYTGYYQEEIIDKITKLTKFNNIIIKFGRYIPNNTPYYNELLGVKLANKEQYAKRIEDFRSDNYD